MLQQPHISLVRVQTLRSDSADQLATTFAQRPVQQFATHRVPTDLSAFDVVIIAQPAQIDKWEPLRHFAERGGAVVAFVHADELLPAWFGAQPTAQRGNAEVRVLFKKRDNPLGVRLPDAWYMAGDFVPLVANSAETILYADWRYTHQPMLTRNAVGSGCAIATTLHDFNSETFNRVLYRLLRVASGHAMPKQTLGVGLLGYAPSVGQLHGQGASHTPGLELRMACDLAEWRLDVARENHPGIRTTTSSTELANDPDIDVVVIATAPSSHSQLTIDMLDAGKHVICEKPLALTVAQVEAMGEAAERNQRHLSCHQNRRWDIDFLAIQRAIAGGYIGNLFYLETFIGGYGHPCGFWHSEESVSGGTTFDWGAHYLDWMLALMPGKITHVIGTRQNRLWHDITNADQERIQLRYDGGQESEFTHSDLAFIPKPKWYLLGDEGAIIGHWRNQTTYDIDPVLYYTAHDIPASEMGAELLLRRRDHQGDVIERPLTLPPREAYPFHRNLADHLLLGEPITVPFEHSARIVGVLEAAKRSAENNARIEHVNI